MQDDGGVQDAGGNVLDDWGRRGELCRTMGGWEGAGRLGGELCRTVGGVQDDGGVGRCWTIGGGAVQDDGGGAG